MLLTLEINVMNITPSLQVLWTKLSDFVQNVCSDRDPTHGHAHMQSVANNALLIAQQLGITEHHILSQINEIHN